jgi:hypothetical protein
MEAIDVVGVMFNDVELPPSFEPERSGADICEYQLKVMTTGVFATAHKYFLTSSRLVLRPRRLSF